MMQNIGSLGKIFHLFLKSREIRETPESQIYVKQNVKCFIIFNSDNENKFENLFNQFVLCTRN